MLQHYSPYKVAENFNVLAALAPGRVDLGVGKPPAAAALNPRAAAGSESTGKGQLCRTAGAAGSLDPS
jgi:alkanesulfonate monooxygenase SsuD/methylene tetrahydromethanopterin reductase-like flavin-dependent oxidoreductase (luciferase family)